MTRPRRPARAVSPPPDPGRARRTLLFVPGDDAHKIGRAARSGADAVVLDLEDGVAADRKDEARSTVARALRDIDFGRSERLVRINPIDGALAADDIRMILETPPDGLVIPKVGRPDDVRRAARLTTRRPRPILALIESAAGVMSLREIAAAHPRLVALLFGAEDLAGDIGATRSPAGHEAAWARGAVVIAAAAAGLQAIDTVHPALDDLEGLERESRLAAGMGYAGKMAIHPRQLPVIAAAFTPTGEEIARALRLTGEHARQQARGRGVFVLDGRMIDWPMVRAAQRLLARARAAGRLDPA